MSTAADHQTKARGLYQLYREEKAHEEKTRRMLNELEANNQKLFDSKLKLIELLLDVQVKDELARQASAEETDMPQINAELIREQARRRMQNEVRAHAGESKDMFKDGFMHHLDEIARMDDDDTRKEVSATVERYTKPHIDKLWRERRRRQDGPLESVAKAAAEVEIRRRAEVKEQQHLRARVDHSDRARRVEQALKMLRRDIGDLTGLLHVQPIDYKTDIGKREAEEHDLRQLIAKQRAEEERLIQERQANTAIIEAEQARLAADVDTVCQQLILLQRELETKEMDLKEMATAQVPGSGSWATSTLQLEKDLSLAIEEEFHLKREAGALSHQNEALQQERALLDGQIATSIEELAERQKDYQDVVKHVEARLNAAKQIMYRFRDDEIDMTAKVNDYLYRILHRREDIRQQKRNLRASINTIISQLSIEDRLQSALTARALELQTQAEKARAQMEHDIATLNSQFVRIEQDLKDKRSLVAQNSDVLTNLWAGRHHSDEDAARRRGDMTATQLNTQVQQLTKEWARVEWEAASGVAQVAARIDHAKRENERVLRQIGHYVILQEDVGAEGVDIATATTQKLEEVKDSLYSDATMRAYREAKYTQSIRLLRERLQLRARGDRSIVPLTLNKHVSLRDKRARREAANRSKQARELALQHIRNYSVASDGRSAASRPLQDYLDPTNASSVASVSGIMPPSEFNGSVVTISGAERAAAEHPEFRRVVIDFIKKEIQPLYDSSQITKKRFIDVVARVSRWFLDTHRPTSELTEQNMNELTRAIQQALTWQDEQRLGVRNANA